MSQVKILIAFFAQLILANKPNLLRGNINDWSNLRNQTAVSIVNQDSTKSLSCLSWITSLPMIPIDLRTSNTTSPLGSYLITAGKRPHLATWDLVWQIWHDIAIWDLTILVHSSHVIAGLVCLALPPIQPISRTDWYKGPPINKEK